MNYLPDPSELWLSHLCISRATRERKKKKKGKKERTKRKRIKMLSCWQLVYWCISVLEWPSPGNTYSWCLKNTFLKYSRASSLTLHISVQSWTPVNKTPWCFSFSKEAAGLIKFSARSGTFFIILIEHSAAYITQKERYLKTMRWFRSQIKSHDGKMQ